MAGITDPQELQGPQENEECPGDGKGPRHVHPCICDVEKYRKKPLTREELKEKAKEYLRPLIVNKKKTWKDMTTEEREQFKAQREEAKKEKLKLEKQERLSRLSEVLEEQRKRFMEQNLVTEPVKGTKYRMEYVVSPDLLMEQRRGCIDWRKEPLIDVKPTKTSELRKANLRYCGKLLKRLEPPPVTYLQTQDQRTLPTPPPS